MNGSPDLSDFGHGLRPLPGDRAERLVPDFDDAYPDDPMLGDADGDGTPDLLDLDIDGDGIPNSFDLDVDGDAEVNTSDPAPFNPRLL